MKKLSAIWLAPPVLVALFVMVVDTIPGGALVIYLVGVAVCFPLIGLSSGWKQYVSIGLAILFLIGAYDENRYGMEYQRRMGMKIGQGQEKVRQ